MTTIAASEETKAQWREMKIFRDKTASMILASILGSPEGIKLMHKRFEGTDEDLKDGLKMAASWAVVAADVLLAELDRTRKADGEGE